MQRDARPHPLRLIVIFLVFMVILLAAAVWLLPVPPTAETVPVHTLAAADSQFVRVSGVEIHYIERGSGEPVFILLHGFGANVFTWRTVIDDLSTAGRVIAFDRPGFGLTERPLPGEGEALNPYSPQGQAALTLGLMDALGIQQAILVGNSAGGSLATRIALDNPQRVRALVLVDAAVYSGGGAPRFIRPLLNSAVFDKWGPYFVRSIAGEQGKLFLESAWADPAKITPEILAGYQLSYQVDDWDAGLWQLTKASQEADLAGQLNQLALPVLVISGAQDQIVPVSDSRSLAEAIPNAQYAELENCGHLPQEECPQAFLQAVLPFAAQQ